MNSRFYPWRARALIFKFNNKLSLYKSVTLLCSLPFFHILKITYTPKCLIIKKNKKPTKRHLGEREHQLGEREQHLGDQNSNDNHVEPKMKGVATNNEEFVPKLSIKHLGDFNVYIKCKYSAPFRVLVDTKFLEKYFLQDTNAVETIQNLLGGNFIFLFTNCVNRNIGHKHLERRVTGVDTQMYHCRDSANDLRKDFDCIIDVIKNDGINERLVLATGNKDLNRLMKKQSLVPIIYFHHLEGKDKEVARELIFQAYDKGRNADLVNVLVKDKEIARATVNVLVDEGFISLGLQYHESIGRIVQNVSELVGQQVVFCTTRCAFKKPSPYVRTGFSEGFSADKDPHASDNYITSFVSCGHTRPRPDSDICIASVAEKTGFAVLFVATQCEKLKEKLSKMRFVNVLSFKDGEILLNNVVAKEEQGRASSSLGKTMKQDCLETALKKKKDKKGQEAEDYFSSRFN